MHHSFLDKFSYLDSPLHRLHPAVKVLAYIVLVILVVTSSILHPIHLILIGFFLVLLIWIAKLPFIFVVRKVLLLVPIFLVILFFLLFIQGDKILWEFKLIIPLSITVEGVLFCSSLIAKSILILLATLLLFSTTQFPDFLYALQLFHAPRISITILSFMYRYVFLLLEEAERMNTARQARQFGRLQPARFFTIGVYLVRAIFVRTFERSERTYQAMCARGFQGEVRLIRTPSLTSFEIGLLIIFVLCSTGIRLFL